MACRDSHPDIICSTESVPQLSIRELFTGTLTSDASHGCDTHRKTFEIPVFQRRYCWKKAQLERLLVDISGLCTPPLLDEVSRNKRAHSSTLSLGCVVVAMDDNDNVVVIDGQQRLTTLCLLISSIKSYVKQLVEKSKIKRDTVLTKSLEALQSLCDHILFVVLDEKPVIRPTFFDRKCFGAVMFGQHSIDSSVKGNDYIYQAKRYFDQALCHVLISIRRKHCSRSAALDESRAELSSCISLVQAVLDKISVQYFCVDKKNDIQSVYERLAMRDAMLSHSLYNSSPGIQMHEVDLVRNFVTSHGLDADSQTLLYQAYWAPIECLSVQGSLCPQVEDSDTKVNSVFLNECLKEFLRNQTNSPEGLLYKMEKDIFSDPGSSCFPLYNNLKECVAWRMSIMEPHEVAGDVIISLLKEFYNFTKNYVENGGFPTSTK